MLSKAEEQKDQQTVEAEADGSQDSVGGGQDTDNEVGPKDKTTEGESNTGTDESQKKEETAASGTGEKGTDTSQSDAGTSDNGTNASANGTITTQETSSDVTSPLVKSAETDSLNEDGSSNVTETEKVAKIGESEYSTLQEAVNAAENDATITLLGDVTIESSDSVVQVGSNKNVTLDLNGHWIDATTYSENNKKYNLNAIQVNGGTLTVKDSTAVQPTVNGNQVTGYKGGYIKAITTTIKVNAGGSFTLKSGKIVSTGNIAVGVVGNQTPESDSNDKSEVKSCATIDDGYLVSQEFAILVQGRGATATVNGGVLEANDNAVVGGNGTNNSSRYDGGTTINIKGGNLVGHIQSKGYIACGIYHPQKGQLNISGGTIYADGGVGVLMRGGTLAMTGGTVTATETDARKSGWVGDSKVISACYGIYMDGQAKYYDASNMKTTISGGKVIAPSGVEALKKEDLGDITVQKGEGFSPAFSKEVPQNYCDTNYYPTDDRTNADATDPAAPYSVAKKITVTFSNNIDSAHQSFSGVAGNLTNGTLNNTIEQAKNDRQTSTNSTTYVFQGWYAANGAKVDLSKGLDRWPEENTTYVAHYKKVTALTEGDKASAGDAKGTALPNSATAEKQLKATENAAAQVAASEADKINVGEGEKVTVVVTVEADKKDKADVTSSAADLIENSKAENETVSYYDISLFMSVVKESDTNPSGTKKDTTITKLDTVSTPIPITLDVSSLELNKCFYRVAHVHNDKITYLKSELDQTGSLLTITMDKFSTVAILQSSTSTVTFDSKGGTDVASQTINYNANGTKNVVTNPAAPTRSGYSFAGWFSDEAYTSAYNFETPVTSSAVTLYAKWTPVSSGGSHKHHNSSTTTTAAAASTVTGVSGAKTGDNANLALWAVLIVLAGAGAAGVVLYEKKKKRC